MAQIVLRLCSPGVCLVGYDRANTLGIHLKPTYSILCLTLLYSAHFSDRLCVVDDCLDDQHGVGTEKGWAWNGALRLILKKRK